MSYRTHGKCLYRISYNNTFDERKLYFDITFFVIDRAETPGGGGVWEGDTPLQIRKKLPPNHLITKCNTVLFVGQYKGHALFVGHCSYIPPQK